MFSSKEKLHAVHSDRRNHAERNHGDGSNHTGAATRSGLAACDRSALARRKQFYPIGGPGPHREGRLHECSGLAKDDQGIWRGTASKNGKSVKVSLDYKGNISEN